MKHLAHTSLEKKKSKRTLFFLIDPTWDWVRSFRGKLREDMRTPLHPVPPHPPPTTYQLSGTCMGLGVPSTCADSMAPGLSGLQTLCTWRTAVRKVARGVGEAPREHAKSAGASGCTSGCTSGRQAGYEARHLKTPRKHLLFSSLLM